ncbi:hypothetical protein PI124_g3912 [Phytophthora idaei]|nr:hypothetical protein PI125_g3364 [Phytophthora idaei]KAG3168262.1 hypothetical protein PI126_g3387 [Phytophthora idaei]KAG3251463.1 hypothetical protein PI124_g3912 [Phytophthora idaei]
MLIAAYWVFPIPFASFTLSLILFAFFYGYFSRFGGWTSFWEYSFSTGTTAKFFTVQMFMVIIYPSYQVLFEAVNQTNYELPVLLLLPTLKLILKNISTFTILHKEDTIPEQVIFTVDFFDAFLPRDMHEKRVVNYNGNSDYGCRSCADCSGNAGASSANAGSSGTTKQSAWDQKLQPKPTCCSSNIV